MITIEIDGQELTTEDGLVYAGDSVLAGIAEGVARNTTIYYAPSMPLALAERVCKVLQGEVVSFPPVGFDASAVY